MTLLRSAPFEDFDVSFNERKAPPFRMASERMRGSSFRLAEQSGQICTFSENAGLRLANSDAEEFVNYNKRFLSRISPGTWRVDSSNLNPQDFWNVGCQLGECRARRSIRHTHSERLEQTAAAVVRPLSSMDSTSCLDSFNEGCSR